MIINLEIISQGHLLAGYSQNDSIFAYLRILIRLNISKGNIYEF